MLSSTLGLMRGSLLTPGMPSSYKFCVCNSASIQCMLRFKCLSIVSIVVSSFELCHSSLWNAPDAAKKHSWLCQSWVGSHRCAARQRQDVSPKTGESVNHLTATQSFEITCHFVKGSIGLQILNLVSSSVLVSVRLKFLTGLIKAVFSKFLWDIIPFEMQKLTNTNCVEM